MSPQREHTKCCCGVRALGSYRFERPWADNSTTSPKQLSDVDHAGFAESIRMRGDSDRAARP
ncbi:hypothetical protein [Streptomyces sp. NBC_00454]|uniref:hypothetical protein n=1 Tax=Streptomyces sp. NBC_00454 TaxID=2975747 RepID=UPI00352F0167